LIIIFENDPLLKGKIAFDEFASRAVVLGAVPWDKSVENRQLGEKLFLIGVAEADSKLAQESHAESNAKEGIIREFVNRSIPLNWDKRTLSERRLYWATEFGRDNMDTVERDRICAAEVWCECFGGDLKYMRRADALEINSILIGIILTP
jgi:putative DNA primase/helicase